MPLVVLPSMTNSLMRFPRDCGPVAYVGPDSVTKQWSIFSNGKPLPEKVDDWMNARFTGAWADGQLYVAKFAMLESFPS